MSPAPTPQKPTKPAQAPEPTQEVVTPGANQSQGQKTNTMAIIALVLAFLIPLVGLILAIVALSQIKKKNEGGKGLAIASIIISAVILIGQILVMILFYGTMFGIQQEFKKQGISVDTNSGTVNYQNKDGESGSIGGGAKLPNGFPDSVPIYPGSKVLVSHKNGADEFNVMLTASGSKAEVEAYYEKNLKKNGWSNDLETSTDFGFASGAQYTKGSQVLTVTVGQNSSDDKGELTIGLVITPSTSTSE